MGIAAAYRGSARLVVILGVLASSFTGATAAVRPAAPPWLERAARTAGAQLSNGSVRPAVSYTGAWSRFPRVVLSGSFVCDACSRPYGAVAPTGTVVELRFDGLTHLSRDFALCRSRARCDAGLCSFGRCGRTADALDAAFAALDARLRGIPGDPDPFSHRPGTFACHIHYPVKELRYATGSCTTGLRLRREGRAEVSFVERWQPREYRQGRWVRLATRTHIWRVFESDGGWKTAIHSSGDPPPQLPPGVLR